MALENIKIYIDIYIYNCIYIYRYVNVYSRCTVTILSILLETLLTRSVVRLASKVLAITELGLFRLGPCFKFYLGLGAKRYGALELQRVICRVVSIIGF